MTVFQIIALILSLTAIFNVIGERVFALPKVIGPMLVALLLSSGLLLWKQFFPDDIDAYITPLLQQMDLSHVVIDGLLGFLLFAGALHLPIRLLEEQRHTIFSLAIISTLLSTALIGGLLWYIAPWFGISMSLLQALAFGALISPTDPVAVLALLKRAALPKRLEVIISGESLFNDAIGMVLFLVLSGLAFGEQSVAEWTMGDTAMLALKEVGGGLLLGVLIGEVAYWLLQNTKDQATQVLITLSVATGGYTFAQMLHTSGPLAMVAAGLIIGNFGLRDTMDRSARQHVDLFWNITDDILNAVLFVLIGIEILLLPGWVGMGLGCTAILLHLLGRFVGVLIPTMLLKPYKPDHKGTFWKLVSLLSWSGLRGGVSVALVLTLPPSELKDILVNMTYIIVLFSIFVQGLSIDKLFKRYELKSMNRAVKAFE